MGTKIHVDLRASLNRNCIMFSSQADKSSIGRNVIEDQSEGRIVDKMPDLNKVSK